MTRGGSASGTMFWTRGSCENQSNDGELGDFTSSVGSLSALAAAAMN